MNQDPKSAQNPDRVRPDVDELTSEEIDKIVGGNDFPPPPPPPPSES